MLHVQSSEYFGDMKMWRKKPLVREAMLAAVTFIWTK
jgi:hypothetical protein